jgi:hypothetical protein
MSCLPGNPCYNTTTVVDPCVTANSKCCDSILYCGPALPNTGIDNLDTLCLALQKIDNEITNIQVNISADNGLTKTGDNIQLGGPLVKSTVITTNNYPLSIVGLQDDPSPDYLLVVSSTGVVRKYAASSLGQTITLEDNVGLVWTNAEQTNLSTLYNTLVPDVVQSVQVGGADPQPAGWWKQKTLVEVLNYILFPLQLPTYTLPTVSLRINSPANPATYLEIGSSISINATGEATKNNAGAFTTFIFDRNVNGTVFQASSTAVQSGTATPLPTQFGFADPNNPNFTYAGTFTQNYVVAQPLSGKIETTIGIRVTGLYGAGLPKKDSYNNDDTRTPGNTVNTPQASGSIMTPETTFTATYPYYFGSITGGSQPTAGVLAGLIQANDPGVNKVLAGSLGNVTVNFNNGSTQKWNWIAIPVSTTPDNTKLSWQDTNTPNNNGNFTNPGGPFFGSPYTQNVTAPGGSPLWANVSYKFYITSYVTAMNSIRFQNTSIAGQP